MARASLTIGQLAASAGVGVETVRFYQRKGLLREPAKPLGGIRHYSTEDADRIRFIKAAQGLGFRLSEVRELLELEAGGSCKDIQALATEKRQAIRKRLSDLQRLDRTLSRLLKQCESTRGRLRCPIVAALQDQGSQ